MNLAPIPSKSRGGSVEEQLMALERRVNALRRNFEPLLKGQIGARNISADSIDIRHVVEELGLPVGVQGMPAGIETHFLLMGA